jgi:4-hydroxybenzoate polyprenyltransferase
MILSFASAWLFSVFQNDIYDEAIDSISNKNRPLIAKTLSQQDMVLTSKIFLIISLLLAYAVGHYTLFFVGLFIFLSHIYSSPPLRLRRFFPINSFIVALACLSAILSGFFLMSPDESIIAFPTTLTLGILVFFTLGLVNFKDIKDIAGDKAAGIQTLPVLLGEKKSKQIIAGILCLFFLAIPFYFRISVLLIPSIITSILTWRFITAKIYEEWKFFLVYNMYLLLIITTISLNIYSFIQ